jgi:hypothetical protein
MALADALGITYAFNDEITFVKARGRGPDEIVAEALLEMGVPMETIQAATKKGKSYFYFQVIETKPEGERDQQGQTED